jgi:hypothetical protein
MPSPPPLSFAVECLHEADASLTKIMPQPNTNWPDFSMKICAHAA